MNKSDIIFDSSKDPSKSLDEYIANLEDNLAKFIFWTKQI